MRLLEVIGFMGLASALLFIGFAIQSVAVEINKLRKSMKYMLRHHCSTRREQGAVESIQEDNTNNVQKIEPDNENDITREWNIKFTFDKGMNHEVGTNNVQNSHSKGE